MSAKDEHPNNAPGVPMRYPPLFERLQIKFMNPIVRKMAPLPGLAIIKHRGRTSGKQYETVVTPYRKGNVVAVMLGHGKTNWVKNVLAAGEADMHLFRRNVHLTNPRILSAGTEDPSLPRIAQRMARSQGVFVADIV
jgi:deazaflavin-dependent oxidoreductase (nitroreductase family)